jgi:hypothetical protein
MSRNTHIQIRLAQAITVIAAAAALFVPAGSAAPFITDTLAPGGTSASHSHFITDTLAPGGGASGVVSVPAGKDFSWGTQASVRSSPLG